MFGDLIVGPEGEKWRGESVRNAQTRGAPGRLLCRSSAIVRDDDRLDQHIEFQLRPPISSLLTDVADGRVEPVSLPSDFMTLTILERAAEHRETDNVGVANRMCESLLAVDADEQRHVVLPAS